ncbi:hypothetical protein AB1L88_15790 [Tautonia sp. JC769]|uniref:hypothetical protein n=1 Tax=Tautonia sp. JC769 TaxID=3232135 RepID=UPI0034574D6C
MKQRRVEFEEAIAYRLMGDCRVQLGPGAGFGGNRIRGESSGDPRSSYQRLRDQVDRLRAASCAVLRSARSADRSELADALEILDAEISRLDAERAARKR